MELHLVLNEQVEVSPRWMLNKERKDLPNANAEDASRPHVDHCRFRARSRIQICFTYISSGGKPWWF